MPLGAHHQTSLALQSLLPLPPPTSQKALSLFLPQKGRNSSRSFTLPLPRPFSGSTADTKEKGAAAGAQTAHVRESLRVFKGLQGANFPGSLFSNPDFTSSHQNPDAKGHRGGNPDGFATTAAAARPAECPPFNGRRITAVLGHGNFLASIRGGRWLFKGRRADGLGEPQGGCPHSMGTSHRPCVSGRDRLFLCNMQILLTFAGAAVSP